MNRHNIITLAFVAALGVALLPAISGAQQKKLKEQLVGTWAPVSVINTAANGRKSELFGPNPKGLMILKATAIFL